MKQYTCSGIKKNDNQTLKCPSCGHWNRVLVNKIFIEQETSEPKVKAYIPMYELLKTEICKKCGKVIAEPKELIRTASWLSQILPKNLTELKYT